MRRGSMGRSAEIVQGGLELAEGVRVSCVAGHRNPIGENFAGGVALAHPGEQLAEMKIAGNILGMGGEQQPEMILRGGGIAGVRAFDGQSVADESIVGVRGREFFQNGAAGFAWRGHEVRIPHASTGKTAAGSRVESPQTLAGFDPFGLQFGRARQRLPDHTILFCLLAQSAELLRRGLRRNNFKAKMDALKADGDIF
jgi:hypothetical protein